MKKLQITRRNAASHWVGDGFPVRSVFSYNNIASKISPFLLMDYGGPVNFPPTEERLGVGEHPHRGFETVTIVYDGEVEHRDSTGAGGKIGPGDVQWMTAASGLVHEEFHGRDYAKRGGPFEMIQLWVNLPAKDKMTKPGYQGITDAQIPRVELPDGAGTLRIIAGEHAGRKGPARTFSPINAWDLNLRAGKEVRLNVPEGHTALLFVLKGKLSVPGGDGARETLGAAELGVLENEGMELGFEVLEDSRVLFLGGQPLGEPIVGYGPFVMNTEAEIRQAFVDFQSGKMGRLS